MNKELKHINIGDFRTEKGFELNNLDVSYQVFGKPLNSAPVVLVNHALTGNSNVAGEFGWWKTIIGNDKVIDTNQFSVLAFNIPGNAFDGFEIQNYKDFIAKDVAQIFLKALKQLNVNELFAIIGGSLGGGIAWEMAAINPTITQNLIPVATDWKATDWLIANCLIQEQFLQNSSKPVHDARMHAMLLYRTPESIKNRFQRTINEDLGIFNTESWLLHHGKKLQDRFQLSAYKLMNQLLKTIAVDESLLKTIKANIHIVAVDSDLFFTPDENIVTYKSLLKNEHNVYYHEIKSIHGHDAFLIEYNQLEEILKPIFKNIDTKVKVY